jgi:hypothetical protein
MWIADPELTVEGAGIAAAPPAQARRGRGRAGLVLGWLDARLRTIPGRLVLISVLVVVGAAVFGIVATGAEQSRERALRTARTDTEPLLAHALTLYTALSDANATVATGLLAGGLEPRSARLRYLTDLRQATGALTSLTRGTGTSGATPAALRTIADQLPSYSGLVETARANNRQNFPIGAAYLRQAAALMTGTMLPAADSLYAGEAKRLNADYATATATDSLVALIVAGAVALVLLALTQRYLTRISRRIFNLPMLIATVALAAVSAWAVIGLISEQNALVSAQRHGSDSVERLSAANVLLSRAQGDLSLTLVNRGTDLTDPGDFTAAMRVLTRSDLANAFQPGFTSYDAAARAVQRLEAEGGLESAIAGSPKVAAMAHDLSGRLTGQIDMAQSRFTRSASDAASALGGLGLALGVITVLAAVLALLGLRQRINEYR